MMFMFGGSVNLQHFMKPNEPCSSPLHLACKSGCKLNVSILLQFDADPDLLDSSGETCLHLAAAKDMTGEITRKLINRGANVNAQDRLFQETPLHKAVKNNMLDNIQVLVNATGIDVNMRDARGDTPLHVAARTTSDLNALDLLLKAKSDLDLMNALGQTPMSVAQRARNKNAVSKIRQYDKGLAAGLTIPQPSPQTIRRRPNLMGSQ